MYRERLDNYKLLEQLRGSKLLVYITGNRPGWETQISQEVHDYFANHLDLFNYPKKISLFLYTCGGNTLAAWSVVNLIKQFCNEFEVIVPSKALSAGTLICLGANSILMTKQATLGPIDPSVNTPLNPQVPGAPPNAKVPVSVEAIKGFLSLAKDELGIEDQNNLTQLLIKLADMVHPLVLGNVYRARTQIQMLARKLMTNQVSDEEKIERIVSFLCSDSGSHDYTINRREARDYLGLTINKPDDNLYNIIKNIYDDISQELELKTPYDPIRLIGSQQEYRYLFRRALIESINGGSDAFVSEGILKKNQINLQQGLPLKTAIEDDRTFEGWRHDDV